MILPSRSAPKVRPGIPPGRRFPKIPQVWAAFEQAGRELAERGAVSWQTARRASQEVIPVPFFGLLKHLPWVRRRVVQVLNDPSFWE